MALKINPDAIYRKIIDEYYILIPHEKAIHRLSDVSAFIWEHLTDNNSENDILNKIVEEYDVSREVAESDLKEFIDELIKKNILIKE
ncbi:MAG: PqqD family protein [bacterium]